MSDLPANARINLERASVLLLDDNYQGLNILVQVMTGFGAKLIHRCTTIEEAQETASHTELHLVLVNASLCESTGYDFVSWLRRSKLEPNCFTPVIVVSGHTQLANVRKARDCGANFIVAKPLAPSVLLDRIVWVAREKRPFVGCDSYIGPDRRFRDDGPPEGVVGRRREDAALAEQVACEAAKQDVSGQSLDNVGVGQ